MFTNISQIYPSSYARNSLEELQKNLNYLRDLYKDKEEEIAKLYMEREAISHSLYVKTLEYLEKTQVIPISVLNDFERLSSSLEYNCDEDATEEEKKLIIRQNSHKLKQITDFLKFTLFPDSVSNNIKLSTGSYSSGYYLERSYLNLDFEINGRKYIYMLPYTEMDRQSFSPLHEYEYRVVISEDEDYEPGTEIAIGEHPNCLFEKIEKICGRK